MQTFTKAVVLISFFLTAISCKSSDPELPTCHPGEKILKTASDRNGTARFDQEWNEYLISSGEPGTYDVMNLGVLCDVPDWLVDTLGSGAHPEGVPVVFSGVYSEYDDMEGEDRFGPCCAEFYYLNLQEVKIREL